MLPPALMAQRLLTGGGLTVLLAWAFGSNLAGPPSRPSGTMVFLLGAVMIAAGVALAQGAPQLTRLFLRTAMKRWRDASSRTWRSWKSKSKAAALGHGWADALRRPSTKRPEGDGAFLNRGG